MVPHKVDSRKRQLYFKVAHGHAHEYMKRMPGLWSTWQYLCYVNATVLTSKNRQQTCQVTVLRITYMRMN